MRVSIPLCLAAASLALPTSAGAREPITLAPVKPWNLHYSDNSCQLFRQFGDPAKPTTLVLESMAPDSGMTMMVFGGRLTSKPNQGTAKAAFTPVPGRIFDDGKITETTEGRQTALYWSSVGLLPDTPRDEPEDDDDRTRDMARTLANRALERSAAVAVTGVQIVEPRQRVTLLQTGSLAKVMEMLRQCNREQMAGWGLDPAIQDKIVLKARSTRNLAALFSDRDYPSLAIRNGEMSVVSARLIVGADGKVSRCTSLTPFTGEGFKEVVCARLSKAVFEPAELADGTKVPTYVLSRIFFKFPD
nr:hypothetical protein [uncultured Sphingomonas sp.]